MPIVHGWFISILAGVCRGLPMFAEVLIVIISHKSLSTWTKIRSAVTFPTTAVPVFWLSGLGDWYIRICVLHAFVKLGYGVNNNGKAYHQKILK